MHKNHYRMFFSILVLAGVLSACAGASHRALDVEGNQVTILADSFSFNPSVIRVEPDTVLEITLENVAALGHNLAIKDPDGRTIVNQDVAAGASERIRVKLERPGIYEFYCDKPLHPSLGMKGEIRVEAR